MILKATVSFIRPTRLRWITIRTLTTQWYFATDVPLKKPHEQSNQAKARPKSFKAFDSADCGKLEAAFRDRQGHRKGTSEVQVREDNLFTVDLDKMELRPTFWEGSTYEVRRGLWFDSNGTPLPHDLSEELEELCETRDKVLKLKGDYSEGKYAVFFGGSATDATGENQTAAKADRETGYILKNLDGGEMLLNYLKSGLGSILPFNGMKITRAEGRPNGGNTGEQRKTQTQQTQGNTELLQDVVNKYVVDPSSSYISNIMSWTGIPGFAKSDTSKIPTEDTQAEDGTKNDYEDWNSVAETSSKNVGRGKRKVDHLVFCVHGIGQSLGKKYEYVNFAHNINLLRKNMKALYRSSDQLKNLNKQSGNHDWSYNSRVQVLPITWRHAIRFQIEPIAEEAKNPALPPLSDIMIPGIMPFRKLFGDVAVDVLLYMSTYYQLLILEEVTRQLNQLYERYIEINPDFDGEVHLIGHSLGSLILFDLLSQNETYKLNFDVSKFFSIGSPIGLLKLIHRIRVLPDQASEEKLTLGLVGVSSDTPNCKEIYNVYHTCDPVAYRIEPLIDPSMGKYEQSYLPTWPELDFTSKVAEVGSSLLGGLPITGSKKVESKTADETDPKVRLRPQENNTGENQPTESTAAAAVDTTVDTDGVYLSNNLKKKLLSFNHTGRVDYALPPSLLEVDIISAIKSHVSYFEDINIAGFLLRELLSGNQPVRNIVVQKINTKKRS